MKLRPKVRAAFRSVLVTSSVVEMRALMSLRRVDTHVFSRPAVASSFDFSKSNSEVLELTVGTLELTIGCHIEHNEIQMII